MLSFLIPTALAADMEAGFVVPSGTTSALSTKVGSFFFSTVVNTIFTAEMLGVLVVLATAYCIIKISKKLFHSVGSLGGSKALSGSMGFDGKIYAGGLKYDEYVLLRDNPSRWASYNANREKGLSPSASLL